MPNTGIEISDHQGKPIGSLQRSDGVTWRACKPEMKNAVFSGLIISRADFTNTDLSSADFRDATLDNCLFGGSDLTGADFKGARLHRCDFQQARMMRARMQSVQISDDASFLEADLSHSDWTRVNVSHADFTSARMDSALLQAVTFSHCQFSGTHLTDSIIADMDLTDCEKLHEARGLHRVRMAGPSCIDLVTLRRSVAFLPDQFLTGIGMLPLEIQSLRELYPNGNTPSTVCILRAEAQSDLALELQHDLQHAGFSVWVQPSGASGAGINEAFKNTCRLSEMFVLLISAELMLEPWLPEFVINVIEREQIDMTRRLFAITCDEVITGRDAAQLSGEMVAAGLWRIDWVRHLQSSFIPDFRARKNPRAYSLNFERLVKLMKATPASKKPRVPALHQIRL